MARYKVLFRADAKASIGIGDLMSLVHLAAYLPRDRWDIHFAVRRYEASVQLLEKRGFSQTLVMEADITAAEENHLLAEYVRSQDIDIVFFEITERPLTEYAGFVTDAAKACVNFDGRIPTGMDLVVNWDVDAQRFYDLPAHPSTTFLFGPRYVILPKEFDFDKARLRLYANLPEKALISMGGGDPYNLTQRVVNTLIARDLDMRVSIVIGAAYPYRDGLLQSLRSSGRKWLVQEDVERMIDFYLDCDVAIGAGGLTASELVATRTPAVLIAAYEHQIARCRYFSSRNWARYLGLRDFDERKLMEALAVPPPVADENPFSPIEIVREIERLAEKRR